MFDQRVLLVVCAIATTTNLVLAEFKLLLLHTNDIHARFQETNARSGPCRHERCFGGIARIKTAVDRYRREAKEENISSIFLNAGDSFQGSPLFSIFHWKVVSELMNMIGIDAMSLGNHEFDDRPEGLAPYIANSSVPIVCANIDYSKEPLFANLTKLMPSFVIDLNGTKVGVIGYVTPTTMNTENVVLLNEVTEIKKEASRLKTAGIKILIALGHSGFATDKLIAEQVPDLDIVVGGHTNTFLYTGSAPDIEKAEGLYPTVVTQPSGRKVLVVQAYAYTKYLGHLELTFDDQGEIVNSKGNPVLIDTSFKKDGAVERTVLKYVNKLNGLAGKEKWITKVVLQANSTCKVRECNFGNFLTDAIIDMNAKSFQGIGWTDAPIAFIPSGELRLSIDKQHYKGAIDFMDVLWALPFTNGIDRLTMKGSVLKEVLEHSVNGYNMEDTDGRFLQYSGLQVKYDLSKGLQERVVSVMVRCGDCLVPQYSPLDIDKEYTVLTVSFMADGLNGYTMMKNATQRTTFQFNQWDVIKAYLTKMSPVYPEISGRIQFVGLLPANCTRSSASEQLDLRLKA